MSVSGTDSRSGSTQQGVLVGQTAGVVAHSKEKC